MSSAVDLDDRRPGAPGGAGRPRRRGDRGRTLLRGVGQTLITFGLVALLFVVYELWVTDIFAARQQEQLSEEIHAAVGGDAPTVDAAPSPRRPTRRTRSRPAPIDVGVGEPFAVLHIPRLRRATTRGWSSRAPPRSSSPRARATTSGRRCPGEQGNFAFAGHRVGRGSPFLDLDQLRPGDPIVVETADAWFVYRVLGDPATGDFGADPSGIPGQEIVAADRRRRSSPRPRRPADGPGHAAPT